MKKKRKADLASPVFQAPPSAKRTKPSPSAQSLLPGAVKPRASSRDVGRIAADLRKQSLDGLNESERERLVDILIHMKSNLLNLPTNDKS